MPNDSAVLFQIFVPNQSPTTPGEETCIVDVVVVPVDKKELWINGVLVPSIILLVVSIFLFAFFIRLKNTSKLDKILSFFERLIP